MTGPKFTPEEDEVIARVYPITGARGCSKVLGRSEASCASRANRLGIRTPSPRGRANPWTVREEKIVAACLLRACRETGRSPMAVIRHMEWLVRKQRQKEAAAETEK